jgi:hypothetical protein
MKEQISILRPTAGLVLSGVKAESVMLLSCLLSHTVGAGSQLMGQPILASAHPDRQAVF